MINENRRLLFSYLSIATILIIITAMGRYLYIFHDYTVRHISQEKLNLRNELNSQFPIGLSPDPNPGKSNNVYNEIYGQKENLYDPLSVSNMTWDYMIGVLGETTVGIIAVVPIVHPFPSAHPVLESLKI